METGNLSAKVVWSSFDSSRLRNNDLPTLWAGSYNVREHETLVIWLKPSYGIQELRCEVHEFVRPFAIQRPLRWRTTLTWRGGTSVASIGIASNHPRRP